MLGVLPITCINYEKLLTYNPMYITHLNLRRKCNIQLQQHVCILRRVIILVTYLPKKNVIVPMGTYYPFVSHGNSRRLLYGVARILWQFLSRPHVIGLCEVREFVRFTNRAG